ncbi:uncharacterized protein DDB_G0290301-like [Oppia nitens]|uniref:uncharacterized protein DDB_G0290301-like n=1 Tax=Oppia nitens TaxID=1686743 RepID=UPI0023DC2AE4|nr:uncharacterized protein DDB_G0290301-like [Oppia nitens]
MRIKTNRYADTKIRRQSLRQRQKNFQNEIKRIVSETVVNDNNKELVDKNILLLSEIETLRKEKLQIFESVLFGNNSQNSSITVKNELMSLLESMKKDHQNMTQMFEKTNAYYNEMINKIEDKVDNIIKFEENCINKRYSEVKQLRNRSECEVLNAQQLYEMKRLSRLNGQQMVINKDNDNRLSVIDEVHQEVVDLSDQLSDNSNDNTLVATPQRIVNSFLDNSVANYALTPHFDNQTHTRTPSIFNFNSTSFTTINVNQMDRTSLSPFNLSIRPELSLSQFESFNTTICDEVNYGMTASTPVGKRRLSGIEMINRQSKRLSSIDKPFSPRIGRTSLNNIQNIMDNNNNNRNAKPFSRPSIIRQSLIEKANIVENKIINQNKNTTKKAKRSKKSENIKTNKEISNEVMTSVNSTKNKLMDITLDSFNSSDNQSVRTSRRNRKQIFYKEPALNRSVHYYNTIQQF